jgi:hypothetical protein
MPFIAIAIALSVIFGGSAVVAHSPAGHAAIEHVTEAWAHAEATATTTDESTVGASHGSLRVRSDADASVQEPTINADGSLKVNIF